MKLIDDWKRCRGLRNEYVIRPVFKAFADREHYYLSLIPTVLISPWYYRYPNWDGVVEIWWMNFHIQIGRWENKEQ